MCSDLHFCATANFDKFEKKISKRFVVRWSCPTSKKNFFSKSTNIDLSYEYWSYEASFNRRISRIIFSRLIILSKIKIFSFFYTTYPPRVISNFCWKSGTNLINRIFFAYDFLIVLCLLIINNSFFIGNKLRDYAKLIIGTRKRILLINFYFFFKTYFLILI